MASKLMTRNMGSLDRTDCSAFVIEPAATGIAPGFRTTSIGGSCRSHSPGSRSLRAQPARPTSHLGSTPAAARRCRANPQRVSRDHTQKGKEAMNTLEQELSPEQNELVAVGASVGAGCHPCVDHHLKAGATAGLGGERLLAAVTSAERVTAEAAIRMGDHVRGKLGSTEPVLLSPFEEALAALGAALGANDAKNIERHLRTALDSGATRPQLEQAVATAHTVQENAMRIHLREAERLIDTLAAAASETEGASDCGCGAEEGNEALEPGAEAADPVGAKPSAVGPERNEDAAKTRINAPAAACADSMAKLFATAGGGELAGVAAAMTKCHRMFEGGCLQPASPADTNEPPTATTTAGSCKEA